jgi:membrane-associated phospholipid phosphatase
VPVLSYSAATLVGITRLTEHEHWASDVFVGGLIGYLCGKQVVSRFNETRQKLRNPLISGTGIKREVTINQYGNQIGLSIRW